MIILTQNKVLMESLQRLNNGRTTSTAAKASELMIYLAGPYTRPDPVANTHAVIKIADALLAAGFVPIVPHLSLAWHLVSPKPYEVWLAYDRQLLRRCDAVLRIPGYSEGATQECRFADSLDIPVIRTESCVPSECVAALINYFSR